MRDAGIEACGKVANLVSAGSKSQMELEEATPFPDKFAPDTPEKMPKIRKIEARVTGGRWRRDMLKEK